MLDNQRRRGDAEGNFRAALGAYDRALGAEHVLVAGCLHDLAECCRAQTRWQEAASLHERALAMREKLLGGEHPQVAQSLHNLALVFQACGQADKSPELGRRALEIREKVLRRRNQLTAALWRFAARPWERKTFWWRSA